MRYFPFTSDRVCHVMLDQSDSVADPVFPLGGVPGFVYPLTEVTRVSSAKSYDLTELTPGNFSLRNQLG